MLLSKLKAVLAVGLVVGLTAGAIGLTYSTGAEPQPARAAGAGRPLADELEELRLEVAALRKGLDATRERVKVLEAEAQARQAKDGNVHALHGEVRVTGQPITVFRRTEVPLHVEYVTRAVVLDPKAQAEAAFRKLLEDPTDQKAAAALEGALKRLKEKVKPDGAKDNLHKQ
jgi:hypothetical protein